MITSARALPVALALALPFLGEVAGAAQDSEQDSEPEELDAKQAQARRRRAVHRGGGSGTSGAAGKGPSATGGSGSFGAVGDLPSPVRAPGEVWKAYTVEWRGPTQGETLRGGTVLSARNAGVVSYKGDPHRGHQLTDLLIQPAPGVLTWWGVRAYELSDWRFERVEIRGMGGKPGKPEGHAFYGNVAGNLSFVDCWFHDNKGQAVQVVARPHSGTAPARGQLLIDGCRFENNGFDSDRAGFAVSVFGPGSNYDVLIRDTEIRAQGLPPYEFAGETYGSRGGLCVAPVDGVQGDSIWFDPRNPDFTNGVVRLERVTIDLERPFQSLALFRGIRELYVEDCTFLGGDVKIDQPGAPGRTTGKVVWKGNQGTGRLWVRGRDVGPVTADFEGVDPDADASTDATSSRRSARKGPAAAAEGPVEAESPDAPDSATDEAATAAAVTAAAADGQALDPEPEQPAAPARPSTPVPEGWTLLEPAKDWTDYTLQWRGPTRDVLVEKTVVRSGRSAGVVSYKGALHAGHTLRDVLIEPAPGRRTWWGVRAYEIADWRFERVEIQHMGGPRGKPEGHAFYANVAGNLSFEDCDFHDNQGQAVQVVARPHSGTAPATGKLRIVNCRFVNNGFESDRAGFPISVFGPGSEYDVEIRDTLVSSKDLPPFLYGGSEFRSRGGVLIAPVNGKPGDSIWFDPEDPVFTNGLVTIDGLTVELVQPFQAAGLFRGIRQLEVRNSVFQGGDVRIDEPGQPGRRCGSIVWEGNSGDGTLFVDGVAVGPVGQDFLREPDPPAAAEPEDAAEPASEEGPAPPEDPGPGDEPAPQEEPARDDGS